MHVCQDRARGLSFGSRLLREADKVSYVSRGGSGGYR